MQTGRAALAAALAALLVGPSSATAGLAPQIIDARGDVKGAQPAYDIVSVTFDTTKVVSTSVVRGKKVKVSTPRDFIVRMELAGAPNLQPGVSYQIIVGKTVCDVMYLYSYWGVSNDSGEIGLKHTMQFADCGPSSVTGPDFVIKPKVTLSGTSITWSVPLKSLPKQMKIGSAFEDLVAYTAITEPLFGYSGVDFAPPAGDDAVSLDYAASNKVYKLGS